MAEAEGLALVGATATGKTLLGMEIADRIRGEIISLDSRQVYRGMDIGTAKADAEARDRVPHHGLDLVEPTERYSAGRFARDARGWIGEIRGRRHVPLLVGGTGFFLRALIDPLFDEPELPPGSRERLRHWLNAMPAQLRRAWLERLDPESARRLHHGGGSQRVLRALEVALLTGRSLPWWHRHAAPREAAVQLLVFVLELPRAELYRRIDDRVDRMLDEGLIDEVRRLLRAGVPADAPGLSATGYRQIVAFLNGEVDLAGAVERIQRETRRYARRQITWFRHQLPAGAIRLDGTLPASELAERVVRTWEEERTP